MGRKFIAIEPSPKAESRRSREYSHDDLMQMCSDAVERREARNGFTDAMQLIGIGLPKTFAVAGGPTLDEARKRILDEIYDPLLADEAFTEETLEALKRKAFAQGACIDMTYEVVAYCVFAVRAFLAGNEVLSWSYACDAAYWAGVVKVVIRQRGLPRRSELANMLATLRREQARDAARAKLANDPKQAVKSDVLKLWQAWQAGSLHYRSGAAFARHAVETFPAIESTKTVERWATAWRKETTPKREK